MTAACIDLVTAACITPTLTPSRSQMTNEPPGGMRNSLLRAYSSVVDQERLDVVEAPAWRQMTYAACFLHSALQVGGKPAVVAHGWCRYVYFLCVVA